MKNLKNKKFRMALLVVFAIVVSFTTTSCNQGGQKTATDEETSENTWSDQLVVDDIWLIDESQIIDISLISDEDEFISYDELNSALEGQDYETLEAVEITEIEIPLDETETLVSYGKDGEEQAVLQVVTSLEDGEIQQIIFIDEKHTDVYDVQNGMSGREVRKLRREVKHMIKKGQVFLYDDSSNIMYLMDAKDTEGDEITEAIIDNIDVQAIIWKSN